MRNAVVTLLLAACATMLTTDFAVAGGGKGSKAKVQIQNTNAAGGRAITAFIIPQGTPAPTTKAQANALMKKNVAAGKTEVFELRNGNFIVVVADTSSFGLLGDNDPIPSGSFSTQSVVLNNKVVTLKTSTPKGAKLPYKPTLN